MALYRNIAGVGGGQVGQFFHPPTGGGLVLVPTTTTTPAILPPPSGGSLTQEAELLAQAHAVYEAQQNEIYNYLMGTPIADLITAGYYVASDGSIFQFTNAEHTASVAYLTIDWIQNIENAAGTAGALLMHMQAPAQAKDTAGYGGGASASNGATTVYSTPIPDVQDLPPVINTPSGPSFPAGTTPTGIPLQTTTTTTQPGATTPTTQGNLLPIGLMAGIALVAIGGEHVIRKKPGLVLVGGVGLLFYLMAKK